MLVFLCLIYSEFGCISAFVWQCQVTVTACHSHSASDTWTYFFIQFLRKSCHSTFVLWGRGQKAIPVPLAHFKQNILQASYLHLHCSLIFPDMKTCWGFGSWRCPITDALWTNECLKSALDQKLLIPRVLKIKEYFYTNSFVLLFWRSHWYSLGPCWPSWWRICL